jgi:DNA-directed RNA polymerase specialized sigma24 family protein
MQGAVVGDKLASMSFDEAELEQRWALVLPHRDRALRVALARTRNRAEAEDIASEALLRVVTVPVLREETVAGLVSTVAIRLALDGHRSEASGRRLTARYGELPLPAADEVVLDNSEASWLHSVVKDLLPLEREVLLHRAAGHTNASAAEVLGVTYKSVASAYTRARTSVRNAWRSTLGISIWVTAGFRKLRAKPTAKAASLAGAAATYLILHGAWSGPISPDERPLFTATSVAHGTTTTGLKPPAANTNAGANRVLTADRRLPVADTQRGSRRTLADTGTVGDPRVVQAGARVTVRHEDETTVQTLQRCLDKGVDIGIYRIACRD